MIKRLFDITMSGIGLIVLGVPLCIIALIIRRDGGPAFYRGVRVGRLGKKFRIFKFRSMVVNAEQMGGSSTADGDSRITSIGKFLRRYKLDELPQLLNVLAGDMSLVGPRPEVQHYVDMYTEEEKEILNERPGITDWASLWNPDEGAVLAGHPDPEQSYLELIRPNKLRLQLEYVRRRTFWIDISIILQTVLSILFRKKPPALEVLAQES